MIKERLRVTGLVATMILVLALCATWPGFLAALIGLRWDWFIPGLKHFYLVFAGIVALIILWGIRRVD